jgi:hypothetical protein
VDCHSYDAQPETQTTTLSQDERSQAAQLVLEGDMLGQDRVEMDMIPLLKKLLLWLTHC